MQSVLVSSASSAPCPLPVDEIFKCIYAIVHLGNELADTWLFARDPDKAVVIGKAWWTEN
jgi:hypothetical protein